MNGVESVSLAVTAGAADRYSILLVGAGLAVCCWLLLRRDARAIAVTWFVTLCFVPIWFGLTYSIYISAATLAGLMAIVSLFPAVPKHVGPADYAMVFVFVSCILPAIVGGGSRAALLDLVLQAGVALVVGRTLPLKLSLDWLYKCASAMFAVVSVLAIIEFTRGWNPFVELARPNALYQTWGTLQERGGITRAEGAFGHSIALGASAAMAIPLTLASSLRPRTKAVLVGLMLGCTVVSFSRTGMISALVGIVLSVLFLREGLTVRARVAIVTVCALLAVALIPFVGSVFAAAGDEATGSAAYRGRLTSLIPDMAVLGFSPAAHRTPAGDLYMGNFRSIDSALILFGLTYGWLPLAFVTMLLLGAIVTVLSGRATAPTISLVAQIPALATVALITQYGIFVWFMAGLALAAQSERSVAARGDPTPESENGSNGPAHSMIGTR